VADISQDGREPLDGVGMVITSTEVVAKGRGTSNLYYKFIPFDFLYTDETEPQVIVSVDGMPALCKNLACGYTYSATDISVESVAVAGNGLDVTITGL
jgi:hypothetical protein